MTDEPIQSAFPTGGLWKHRSEPPKTLPCLTCEFPLEHLCREETRFSLSSRLESQLSRETVQNEPSRSSPTRPSYLSQAGP